VKTTILLLLLTIASVSWGQTCPEAGEYFQSGSITVNGSTGPSDMTFYDPSDGALYSGTGSFGSVCAIRITEVYATVDNLSSSPETAILSVWDCGYTSINSKGCGCDTWPLSGVAPLVASTQVFAAPGGPGRVKLTLNYLSVGNVTLNTPSNICVILSGLPTGNDRGGNLWNASIQIPKWEAVNY
jgi:hypothetical protein